MNHHLTPWRSLVIAALIAGLTAGLTVAPAGTAQAQTGAGAAPGTQPAPPAPTAPNEPPRSPRLGRPDLSVTSEDLRITRNIRDSLQRAVMDSDPLAIRIVTRKGAVTLSGSIKDAAERAQVEALVRGTPGAMTLTDRLLIP